MSKDPRSESPWVDDVSKNILQSFASNNPTNQHSVNTMADFDHNVFHLAVQDYIELNEDSDEYVCRKCNQFSSPQKSRAASHFAGPCFDKVCQERPKAKITPCPRTECPLLPENLCVTTLPSQAILPNRPSWFVVRSASDVTDEVEARQKFKTMSEELFQQDEEHGNKILVDYGITFKPYLKGPLIGLLHVKNEKGAKLEHADALIRYQSKGVFGLQKGVSTLNWVQRLLKFIKMWHADLNKMSVPVFDAMIRKAFPICFGVDIRVNPRYMSIAASPGVAVPNLPEVAEESQSVEPSSPASQESLSAESSSPKPKQVPGRFATIFYPNGSEIKKRLLTDYMPDAIEDGIKSKKTKCNPKKVPRKAKRGK